MANEIARSGNRTQSKPVAQADNPGAARIQTNRGVKQQTANTTEPARPILTSQFLITVPFKVPRTRRDHKGDPGEEENQLIAMMNGAG